MKDTELQTNAFENYSINISNTVVMMEHILA